MVQEKQILNYRILLTLAYFNLIDYPPTSFEIWRNLLGEGKIDFFSVVKELEKMKKNQQIFSQKSFWFLKNKENLVVKRNRNQKITVGKIKRMVFWSKLIGRLPFIRGIFVRGALALGMAEKNSDWDVLIVTKKKRIWLARFFLIVFLEIFQKRRKGRGEKVLVKDRFCLNHFLSEEGLILEKQNQFIAHEESFSFPLMGADMHKKFLNLNRFWLEKKRGNFEVESVDSFWMKKSLEKCWLKEKIELLLERVGLAEFLNQVLKKWMLWLIENNPKTNWPGADIRYSDQALVFIPNPWRDGLEEKAKKWVESLK